MLYNNKINHISTQQIQPVTEEVIEKFFFKSIFFYHIYMLCILRE